jgi:hypothetical protein
MSEQALPRSAGEYVRNEGISITLVASRAHDSSQKWQRATVLRT